MTVDALQQLYERAVVEGTRNELRTDNVAALSLEGPSEPVIDGHKMPRGRSFVKRGGRWVAGTIAPGTKRHGLQGPIDDAFMDSFLVVNPPESFRREWAKWMRGDLRVKAENSVTAADMRAHHVVLFGTPETNRLIRRVNAKLPVRWSAGEIVAGSRRFDARTHTLKMICLNPLEPSRYVVLNSGHTFGEREFRGTNALLFPRLGDWAVVRDSDQAVVAAGIFDIRWQFVL